VSHRLELRPFLLSAFFVLLLCLTSCADPSHFKPALADRPPEPAAPVIPKETVMERGNAKPVAFPQMQHPDGQVVWVGMDAAEYIEATNLDVELEEQTLTGIDGTGIFGTSYNGSMVHIIIEEPWQTVDGVSIGDTKQAALEQYGVPELLLESTAENKLVYPGETGTITYYYDDDGSITRVDVCSVDNIHAIEIDQKTYYPVTYGLHPK